MSNFHVGQKVICVVKDDKSPQGHTVVSPIVTPDFGQIYTVRAVSVGVVGGEACLRLEEIADQIAHVLVGGQVYLGDVIFPSSCFRPVVERKTDISVFQAMLTGKKVEVTA